MSASASVGVAVITHRAREQISSCLPPFLNSPLRPRVLVVNSSSCDGTAEEAQRLGAETLLIERHSFNHGTTREIARRHLATDVVVMTVPDARARDQDALGRLVEPVLAQRAAVAYGRQVTRPGAHIFEVSMRRFNYPPESHVRSIVDAARYGSYLFFCSNAFAAYRNDAMDAIGGFQPTLAHEDAVATAMLLRAGYSVAYVAEAVVEHSHQYRLANDFRRYFDAGLGRKPFKDLFSIDGGQSGRGARFAGVLLLELVRFRPWLVPYGLLAIMAKGLGYTLGGHADAAPIAIKRALSNQDYYWSANGLCSSPKGSGAC